MTSCFTYLYYAGHLRLRQKCVVSPADYGMPVGDSILEEKSKKPATHAERNAADLEKMTDNFEETEVTAGMTDALKKVTEEKHSAAPAPRIKIKSEDVDLIVSSVLVIYAALFCP